MEDFYKVYAIREIASGRIVYIGKTGNFKYRKYQHLKGSTNTSKYVKEVGAENIEIFVLKGFDNNRDAIEFEDELICKYDTINNGWNTLRSGGYFGSKRDCENYIRYSNLKKEKRLKESTKKRSVVIQLEIKFEEAC